MNKLAGSTSPYLLQHVDNPVAWEPWGPEALERARREEKPIFLSIGYSACHWCHVMAHESFEDPATAELLNESFVNIKVDREERPDLDTVYMAAVQLLTGRGGWPMSVFLTPDLEPFFAGTYWPPEPRHGMPAFPQVVAAVTEAWRQRREAVVKQAAEITAALVRPAVTDVGLAADAALLDAAALALERSYEPTFGGFGSAPKFPHAMDLRLLLRTFSRTGRTHDLEMVTHTLACMAAGGMHDHLGGGFARYSVDDRWLVPHFEKMLYDNALLATAYLEAFLVTGRGEFAAVVRSTLDYVLRDMTDPAGGFWSAEDADSEGEEGTFYVWTPTAVAAVLPAADAALFCEAYDITERGNFEGHSIPHLRQPLDAFASRRGLNAVDVADRLAASRRTLLEVRSRRVRPGTDDKVLVAWNGLMIDALARAGAALEEPRYVTAAERAAAFVLAECRDGRGRLSHQWRRGRASGLAFADDVACLTEGLMSLYEATFAERWIVEADAVADLLLGQGGFIDPDTGGVFQTCSAHERLIVRQPDLLDNATPGATGMTATALARLAAFTGRDDYRVAAERAVAAAASIAARAPGAVPQSLLAADFLLGPLEEDVVVGDFEWPLTRAVIKAVRGRFRPRGIVAARPGTGGAGPLDGLFEGRPGVGGDVTLFRCHDRMCAAPAVGDAAVAAAAAPRGPA
jgi:uncharacterized protein YyaL (SSP411 family)